MQVDRSLHVCLVGDTGIGQTTFLQCFRGESSGENNKLERFVTLAELDGEPFCVRFTDTAGSSCFDSMWHPVLGSAHAVLLCYAVDREDSFLSLMERWLPIYWSSRSEAPIFIIGLRADLRSKVSQKFECVSEGAGYEFAQRVGAISYLECSAFEPDSVQAAIDQVLLVAREFYSLQWQLGPPHESDIAPIDDASPDAPWLNHERLNIADDPMVLDLETVQKNLSMLGATPAGKHAYLRIDIADKGLTSLDAIRSFQHLQFVNLSGNRLRSLEPLGSLRCLLHLNASFNLLIRTQGFTAPDQLETVDMSYNLISDLGEWVVHKYLRELNIRGNFIERIGAGLSRNRELRMLDFSENHLSRIENLDGLGLHTLYLAQNRLTSLQGIGLLKKLQVLNVRHNCITSVAALRAEDIPRMRKICISENRVAHIQEIEGLQSFPFLCDLLLAPNPIAELPQYREQVLHRLPNLRLLDRQAASAEEKVKADVIYGNDVERRKVIFDAQLPEETFVDRRLVTQEGIAQMEMGDFGQEGCPGDYGTSVFQEPDNSRSRFQDTQFRQRLEIARRGGEPVGVCDLQTCTAPFLRVKVFQEDLREVLEVCGEGGIQRLLLGDSAACFGPQGVKELLNALEAPGLLCHLDLSGCSAVSEVVGELLANLPYDRGCSIEASNTGISNADVERLRNSTPEAADAPGRAAAERQRTAEMCAAFLSCQEALEDFAAENVMQNEAPASLLPLHHPNQWREGIEARALAMHQEFVKKNPTIHEDRNSMTLSCVDSSGTKVTLKKDEYTVMDARRREILKEFGYMEEEEREAAETEGYEGYMQNRSPSRPLPAAFEKAFAPVLSSPNFIAFMLWNGVRPAKDQVQEATRQRQEDERIWKERVEKQVALSEAATNAHDTSLRPQNVASAQLIAHFTYLCLSSTLKGNDALKPPSRFGLKWLSKNPRSKPRHGRDLHAVVLENSVVIESVVGSGFGIDSLELTLQSSSMEDMLITVQRGTIFQQADWEHRDNLMVAMDYVIALPSQATMTKKMMAYCMNRTCACSNGNLMNLTEFYFDDSAVLESQGLVWDHFEQCFNKDD